MKAPPQPEMMRLILDKIRLKGYVGAKEIERIAARLRIPSSRVYGFVSQFDELPQRPYRARMRVCVGPACADAGAWAILEELKHKAPTGVEVLAEPGIPNWHRLPAVCIEVPGEEAVIVEGLIPDEIDTLFSAMEKNRLPGARPLRDAMPPPLQTMPGREPSPWSASAQKGSVPEAWGPEQIARAAGNPDMVEMKIGSAVCGASVSGKAAPSPVLVCDLVGAQTENSVSLAAYLLHPRAVIAGSAIAASACRARRLVFYLPWSETRLAEELESAADDLLSGVGVKHSIFRGPAQVPCARDIGRAAVMQGMMLWQAASLYGWHDTRTGDPPLVVLDAEEALKMPWLISEDFAQREGWADMRLLSLIGDDGAPRFLEVPSGMRYADILHGLGLEAGNAHLKAVHVAAKGTTAVDPAKKGGEIFEHGGEVIMLDPLTCIPRWALYLAWYAERACCGGCVPGRTAPAAAARLIQSILRAEGGEASLEDLDSLLADAGGLALCPRLHETLDPILICLREFRDEFEIHAKEGVCRSGSCSPAVEVATHGG